MQTFNILKGRDKMNVHEVKKLIAQTYWAKDRSIDVIQKSMENSICFGVFLDKDVKQVGFARVITDYATTYYICDVIIDSEYRGNGLGKKLLESIESDQEFCDLKGILVTKDAHGLYEKFGFAKDGSTFMQKARKSEWLHYSLLEQFIRTFNSV